MDSSQVRNLEPKLLWNYFYEMSQIPRPSKKEEKIRQYVIEFAKSNNFKYVEDETGNIVVYAPATPGYENTPTIVLQGHVDMVCEKNKDKEHDFEKDPIDLIIDNGWVKADRTTLGADNAIGLAAGMAIATDKDTVHGPLELLFTVDEETGLTGAHGLPENLLKGKYLLNLDGEGDGVFYIGCAGGLDTVCFLDIEEEDNKFDTAYNLMITGLKGGHSGVDIHLGRGNSIKILARLLNEIGGYNYSLNKISGGSLRNAIPREAETTISFNSNDENEILNVINSLFEKIQNELRQTEPGLIIKINKVEKPEKAYSDNLKKRLVQTLIAMPHGVISMSQSIEGLVETSTNLATIGEAGTRLRIGTSQRSSIDSAKLYISEMVKAVIHFAGGVYEINDGYPGWQPNIDADLVKISREVYEKQYSSTPEITAVHAGLECGLLSGKYPALQMISFGPTIIDAHSPAERVDIATVQKMYEYLKLLLKQLAS